MVDKPLSTNDVRKKLEDLGVVCPSRRAVEIVALQIGQDGPTSHWQMVTPDHLIKQAIIACKGIPLEESYRVFAQHCQAKALTSI